MPELGRRVLPIPPHAMRAFVRFRSCAGSLTHLRNMGARLCASAHATQRPARRLIRMAGLSIGLPHPAPAAVGEDGPDQEKCERGEIAEEDHRGVGEGGNDAGSHESGHDERESY
jgi:hypothetical protein